MSSFRRFSRRAWLLHGYLLASLILWPVPSARSYWTSNGGTTAKVEVNDPDSNIDTIDSATGDPITIPNPWWGEDSDTDGLNNIQEIEFGSDPYNRDSDFDGLTDTDERDLTPSMFGGLTTTDPWNWDSNGNGYSDHDEYWAWQSGLSLNVNYTYLTPPSPLSANYYRDADGDGTYNLWDYAPTDSTVASPPPPPDPSTIDSDWDGHVDASDSHPYTNWLWEDWNNNGTNDSQEYYWNWYPSDSDSDGYNDSNDSHPYSNWLWEDWNWNGINDSQENTPTSPPTDSDGDTHPDNTDSDPNNPALWEDWNRNGSNDSSEPPDSDGDGVVDDVEYSAGTNPWFHDSDGDGLSDGEERTAQTNPLLVDTDGDGLTDHEEIFIFQKNPLLARSQPGQQQTDYYQVNLTDGDLDGIPDLVEAWYGRDPGNDADASSDLDLDGRSDFEAYLAGWSFTVSFTSYDLDRDGITDAREGYWGLNPYDPDDATQDADHDGLLNIEEIRLGLNLFSASTNGMPDLEYANNTWNLGWQPCLSPGSSATSLDDDTDGDGMSDNWEYRHRLNLRDPSDAIRDPDKDSLSNLTEFRFQSHPRIPRTQNNTQDRTRLYATGKPLNASTAGGLMNRYRAKMAADLGASSNLRNYNLTIGQADDEQEEPPPGDPPEENCGCGYLPCPQCDGTGRRTCGKCGGDTWLACSGTHEGDCSDHNPVCPGHGSQKCSGSHTAPCPGMHEESYRKEECSHECSMPACYKVICGKIEFVHTHTIETCDADGDGDTDECEITGHGHVDDCYDLDCPHKTHDPINCYVDATKKISCDEYGCGKTVQVPCTNDNCEMKPCPGGGSGNCPDGKCQACNNTGKMTYKCKDPDTCDGGTLCDLCCGGTIECGWCDGDGEKNENTCVLRSYCSCRGVPYSQCPHAVEPGGDDAQEPEDPSGGGAASFSDSAGSRYRKIGLNGLPLPDTKPQNQDETGSLEEETYIDAYTLQLRHSVSDVYAEAPGSLLNLMVRRDCSPTIWAGNDDFVPDSNPALPFGAGWSSNIVSYVKFDPSGKAQVVDDQGGASSFKQSGPGSPWIHDGSEQFDAKSFKSEFTGALGGYRL